MAIWYFHLVSFFLHLMFERSEVKLSDDVSLFFIKCNNEQTSKNLYLYSQLFVHCNLISRMVISNWQYYYYFFGCFEFYFVSFHSYIHVTVGGSS